MAEQTDELVKQLIMELLKSRDVDSKTLAKLEVKVEGLEELAEELKQNKQDKIKLIVAIKESLWARVVAFIIATLIVTASVAKDFMLSLFR